MRRKFRNVEKMILQNITLRAIVLTALALLLPLATPQAAYAAPPQTKAAFALLIDDTTGAVLFAKNADASMSPASTTKILTAAIVFRELAEGRLKLDDIATISPRAAREGDAESGGSSMFAEANTQQQLPCVDRREVGFAERRVHGEQSGGLPLNASLV